MTTDEYWNGVDLRAKVRGLEQQLAACQADNLRLWKAIEFYLAANDPSEFGCACDPSVGYLCGPCHASKQQTQLRQALDTPLGDLSALREVCAKVLIEATDKYLSTYVAADEVRRGEWTPESLK